MAETVASVSGLIESFLGAIPAMEFLEAELAKAEPPRKKGPRVGWVYLLECPVSKSIKVGFSSCVESRVSALQTGAPARLRLLAKFSGVRSDETEMRRLLRVFRVHGEWFDERAKSLALAAFREKGSA